MNPNDNLWLDIFIKSVLLVSYFYMGAAWMYPTGICFTVCMLLHRQFQDLMTNLTMALRNDTSDGLISTEYYQRQHSQLARYVYKYCKNGERDSKTLISQQNMYLGLCKEFNSICASP